MTIPLERTTLLLPAWHMDDKTAEMGKQGKRPSKRRRNECPTRTVSSNWQNGQEAVTGDPVGQQRSSACVGNAARTSLDSLSGLSVGPFISSASHAT
jgi:hypothetical protein